MVTDRDGYPPGQKTMSYAHEVPLSMLNWNDGNLKKDITYQKSLECLGAILFLTDPKAR